MAGTPRAELTTRATASAVVEFEAPELALADHRSLQLIGGSRWSAPLSSIGSRMLMRLKVIGEGGSISNQPVVLPAAAAQ